MLAYAATLTPDEEDGGYVVTFRDVPEAITQGETLARRCCNAADALAVALEFLRYRQRFPSPRPSLAPASMHHRLARFVAAKLGCIGACARRARRG